MSTLRGMFDAKPRSRRNFLQENIKDVSKGRQRKTCPAKSFKMNLPESLPKNLQPKAKIYNPSRQPFQDPAHKLPITATKHMVACASTHIPKGNANLSASPVQSFSQAPSEVHTSCVQKSRDSIKDCTREEIDLLAHRLSYIDEENVPFRWTKVCPSIITHTVCHQAVQTPREEDFNSLYEEGSIKYPSFHDLQPSDDKTSQMLSILEWPSYAQDENPQRVDPEKRDSLNRSSAARKQLRRITTSLEKDRKGRPTGKSMKQVPVSYKERGVGSCSMPFVDSEDQCPSFHDAPGEKGLLSGGTEISIMDSAGSTNRDQVDHSDKWVDSNSGLPIYSFQEKGVLAKYGPLTPAGRESISTGPKTPIDQVTLLAGLEKAFPTEEAKAIPKASERAHHSEAEKRLNLEEASRAYDNLVAELNKMPVMTNTLKTKKRKMEIEKELDLLERRIRALSRICGHAA